MAQKGMNGRQYDYMCIGFNCRLLMSPKKKANNWSEQSEIELFLIASIQTFLSSVSFHHSFFLFLHTNWMCQIELQTKARRWNIAKSNIVRSVRELSEEWKRTRKKKKMKKNLNGAKSNYVSARSCSQG